jgi:uncharacterized protein (DUF736 family)
MPVIGTFKADKDGYAGTIRTLSINAKVRIVANDRKGTGSSPDFRVFAGQMEVGAAWRKTAREKEASYLSVRLDDPVFPEPIHAALMEQTEDGVLRLLWRRDKPDKREEA